MKKSVRGAAASAGLSDLYPNHHKLSFANAAALWDEVTSNSKTNY